MNPPTSIEDLPPEMIYELFRHLQPKDLIICSRVNKRWHSIYSGVRLERLAAITGFLYPLGNWRYSTRKVQHAELCHPIVLSRLAKTPLLSKLKYLALCGYRTQFDLNTLNVFDQLVHLEINIEHRNSRGEEASLHLPKLRLLSFLQFVPFCHLSIDCPELNTLIYTEPSYMKLLDVKHPETICKLDTEMFGSQLVAFRGVQCLVARKFKAINKATLQSLPSLKELHYNVSVESAFLQSSDEVGTPSQMKQKLREFLDHTNRLEAPDFRFRFAGFRLTKTTLNEIDLDGLIEEREIEGEDDEGDRQEGREIEVRERMSNEYVYMRNYHLIEPDATLEFVDHLNYSRLMASVTGEFPGCFFKKFTQVQSVEVDGAVQDEAHLLWFLKSLNSVRKLELKDCQLSQAFYDQLPSAVDSFTELSLGKYGENELQLNFDFIGKLALLASLHVGQYLSFESLKSLTHRLDEFTKGTFCFRWKSETFYIKKKRASNVCQVSGLKRIQKRCPPEIADFFEKLQTRTATLESDESSGSDEWNSSDEYDNCEDYSDYSED